MKPVPQTIQLGAFTYAIKRCDGGEPSRIDCDKQEIWLSESLHPQQAAYCLFREALAVAMRDSAESTVHTDDIALKVIELWAQNPEVVAWIMAGLVDSKKPLTTMQIDPGKIVISPAVQVHSAPHPADASKSIWWKEPVYTSVDGIAAQAVVNWKVCEVNQDDHAKLKKLKLSPQEACDEGLASIVDDRFQFVTDKPEQASSETKQETF